MPVRGGKNVRRNLNRTVSRVRGRVTDQALAEVLVIGEGHAKVLTPIDTRELINSQYSYITSGTNGAKGVVGYRADYALAVHEASGKLKGVSRSSGEGSYWDPRGEPEFLRKGFEEGRAEIDAAIRRGYRL